VPQISKKLAPVFLIIVIFLIAGTQEAGATFKRCRDIAKSCGSSSAFYLGLCTGYLEGLADTEFKGVCIDEEATPKQLQEQYLKWFVEHPEEHFSNASVCFRKAFSCKER
jgi:hypothetical protein